MGDRLRLVGWQVQPMVMADDGERLTPVQVAPALIPAAGWEQFKAGGDAAALEQIQAQLDNPSATEQ